MYNRAMQRTLLTVRDAAELVGIPSAQLRLWLEAGKITATSTYTSNQVMLGSKQIYLFSEDDLEPIRRLAKKIPKRREPNQFVDDGEQEHFTVADIASLWKISTDTVQRMFEDEPGVLPIGKLRGKRRTIRIPRAVMERVKKRRSNL
jgi:hypothetical protein